MSVERSELSVERRKYSKLKSLLSTLKRSEEKREGRGILKRKSPSEIDGISVGMKLVDYESV